MSSGVSSPSEVEAIVRERHFDRAQAVRLEQAVHLVVRRRRQHDRVALRAERAQHEVEALLRARGDQDVVGTRRRIVAARAFADLLAQLGAVQAVNLDGGGSTTAVLRGAVYNRPHCADTWTVCERLVTSTTCVLDA